MKRKNFKKMKRDFRNWDYYLLKTEAYNSSGDLAFYASSANELSNIIYGMIMNTIISNGFIKIYNNPFGPTDLKILPKEEIQSECKKLGDITDMIISTKNMDNYQKDHPIKAYMYNLHIYYPENDLNLNDIIYLMDYLHHKYFPQNTMIFDVKPKELLDDKTLKFRDVINISIINPIIMKGNGYNFSLISSSYFTRAYFDYIQNDLYNQTQLILKNKKKQSIPEPFQ